MKTPLVYVIIINWNGRAHLDTCFSSLRSSDYPQVHFLLLDNASEDDSVAYVQEHFGHDPRVSCLAGAENYGWSGGNNLGIRKALEAGADYIFLLNNDIAIAPDAISHLVAQAEASPHCGCLAPKMLLFDTPTVLNSVGLYCSIVGAAWDRGIGRADGPQWDEPIPVIGVCGGAMFIRASVFTQTGLLPEDFIIYLDDLDLCLRIWSFGHTIETCPKAEIRHKFSASMGQDQHARRKYFLNTRNRFRVILRNFPLRHWPQTAFWVGIGELRAIGRAFLDAQYWRMGVHAHAWLSALGQLPGALWHRFHLYRQGARPARFWRLIERRWMFCPAMALPQAGWYAPKDYALTNAEGNTCRLTLRPMAPDATLRINPRAQREILHVNCYPALGETHIDVFIANRRIATWQTGTVLRIDTMELLGENDGEAVELKLCARTLFYCEDTGEDMDIGGWFG